MILDIPALKAAAQAATPGPWTHGGREEGDECVWAPHGKWVANVGNWAMQGTGDPIKTEQVIEADDRDAAYIALANPAAVLALIERLDRAVQHATEMEQRYYSAVTGRDELRARVAELEQQVTALSDKLFDATACLHCDLGRESALCSCTTEHFGRVEALKQQVAALANALGHAVHRNHAPSDGCDGCVGIDAALRAAGRKNNG